MNEKLTQNNGFTLVELMIALVVSGIIIGAIYSVYTVQQRTYIAQEQVVDMQQNIRAGFDFMTRDIRMMAYGSASAGSAITAATGTTLSFTMDLNEDGDLLDSEENLTYSLYTDTSGKQNIGRMDNTSGSPQNGAVAININAIEFYYTLDDGTQTTTPGAANFDNIRAVTASILARADRPDQKFTNTMLYCPASYPIKNLTTSPPQCEDSTGATLASATWGPYNDNFRRRLLITTVQCRNMGLQ